MKMKSGYSMGVAEAIACQGPMAMFSSNSITLGTLVSISTLT